MKALLLSGGFASIQGVLTIIPCRTARGKTAAAPRNAAIDAGDFGMRIRAPSVCAFRGLSVALDGREGAEWQESCNCGGWSTRSRAVYAEPDSSFGFYNEFDLAQGRVRLVQDWPPTPSADLLDRPRLYSVLNDGHALTALSGPAGSGKSTLLVQWAHTRPVSDEVIVFVRLGFENSTPRSTWRLAMEGVLAQGLTSDPDLIHETLRGFGSIRLLLDRLIEVFSTLTSPCVIVVDNHDYPPDHTYLLELVGVLAACPTLRIVIATRTTIPRTSFQEMSRIDSALIGPNDLMFTAQEARDAIGRIVGAEAPANITSDLSALPLTARVIGLAIKAGRWPSGGTTFGRELVADAVLARSLSDGLPGEFRRFLLETSAASVVTDDLAERLGWGQTARQHLATAETLGLGMWHAEDDVDAFVYSPLLREALERQFSASASARVAEVRRKVAVWAYAHERSLEALTCAVDAGDYYLASQISRNEWFSFAQTGVDAVIEILRKQHPSTLNKFPTLAMLMALLLVAQGKRLRAKAYFEAALKAFSRKADPADSADRIWILSIESLAGRFVGRFDRAAVTGQEVVELLAVSSPAVRNELERSLSLMLSNCGISLFYAGRVDEAIAALELGMSFQIPDDNAGWYHCASTLAGIAALQGDLALTRRILEQIEAVAPPVDWQVDLFGFFEQLARAFLALGVLDFAEARERLDSVRHHMGNVEHWAFHAGVESRLLLLEKSPSEALALVDNALRRGANPKTSGFALQHLARARLMALLALGRGDAVDRVLATLPKNSSQTMILRGLCELMRGQYDAVYTTLGGVAAGVVSVSDLRAEAFGLVAFALAAARCGEPAQARAACLRALAVVGTAEIQAVFYLLPRDGLLELRELLPDSRRVIVDDVLDRFPGDDPVFPELSPAVLLSPREIVVLRELARTPSGIDIAAARRSLRIP